MNLYIKKISFLLLSLAFIFTACETEESIQITSPDPAFILQQPGISNVFLNFGTPSNSALTLSWNDEITGSTSYDVEMALKAEFTTPITVGTSDSNSFTMSVTELNDAVRSAGVTAYVDIATYFRINAGSTLSNEIQYTVTTYPVELPEITSPANNDAFILLLGSASETAMTVEWTDPVLSSNLEIDVNYTVEAALVGTNFAAPATIGTITNGTTISSTHTDLNAAAIGIGLMSDIAGDIEIRVVAKNLNENENELVRVPEIITVSVTPYNVSFPYLYMVGDATTPGWNPDNNNTPIFRDQNVPNGYFFTGYFNAGAFKLLETTDWQPQWGTNDGSTLAVNLGGAGGSDPGTFNVGTAGYYTYTFTTVGEAGSFTVAPFDASGSTTYATIGVIGDATPDGWAADTDMTQDANNPHLWYINGISLTGSPDNSEPNQLKFRADDDWIDNWGDNGSTETYGISQYGAPNNFRISETGTYDIWFNDLDRSYLIIKQ